MLILQCLMSVPPNVQEFNLGNTGSRKQIYEFPVNEQDEIRHASHSRSIST